MSQILSRPLAADTPPVIGHTVEGDQPTAALTDPLSARTLLSPAQSVTLVVIVAAVAGLLGLRLLTGLGPSALAWAVGRVGGATIIYIAVIAFRIMLVLAAQDAPVMRFTREYLSPVPDTSLPWYSILVPLYREEK